MLELDCIPEIRSVIYMITEPGSMTRSWAGGIAWILPVSLAEDGVLIPMLLIIQSALLIRMGCGREDLMTILCLLQGS